MGLRRGDEGDATFFELVDPVLDKEYPLTLKAYADFKSVVVV